jgi:hypothetical protein
MVMQSSLSTSAIPTSFAIPVSEKLTKGNYLLWKAQVLPAIRAAQLDDILTGIEICPPKTISDASDRTVTVANLAYGRWIARNQAVLGYLLSSLSHEVLSSLINCSTSSSVWTTLSEMYSSHSRARKVNTQIALAKTKKGASSVAEYFAKMRGFADELGAAGKPLDDEEFVSFLLTGLDEDFNPLVTAVVARSDLITPGDLYTQLLSYENRMHLQTGSSSLMQSSANAASCGRGMSWGRSGGRGFSRGRGRGRGPSRGGFQSSGRGNNSSGATDADTSSRPRCQVCSRVGHTALNCWYRFDENYVPDQRSANSSAHQNCSNVPWYTDIGATDHITGDLDRLTMHDKYLGTDQIIAANGTGMTISNIGNAIVPTSSRSLHLRSVLHVSSTHKNLKSVHRLTNDNDVFIEFHSSHFLIKDRQTKAVLLHGKCRDDLYPLPPHPDLRLKHNFSSTRVPLEHWHKRLGHPSRDIVHRVISNNNFPCLSNNSTTSVCDACLQAKAHQLPYTISMSQSSAPLMLLFSDVFGPTIDSFGRYKYYVSFINDYSKFTWIYLLRLKSDVYKSFCEF